MKQSLKLKSLVLALGLVGAMHSAHAAILHTDTNGVPAAGGTGSLTGGSSFLFFAYDGAGKSFLKSVNFTMSQIGSQTSQVSFSLPNLSTFFSGSTDAQWGIVAADTKPAGSGAFAGYGIHTGLVSNDVADVSLTKSAAKINAQNLQAFLNTADAEAPTHAAGDVITSVSTDDSWNLANLTFNAGGSNLTDLSNGATLFAWSIAANDSLSGLTAQATKTLLSYSWSLDLSGNQLSFAAPPPAPVPVPAAVWLLGSALATVAGVRRRRHAAALTA